MAISNKGRPKTGDGGRARDEGKGLDLGLACGVNVKSKF